MLGPRRDTTLLEGIASGLFIEAIACVVIGVLFEPLLGVGLALFALAIAVTAVARTLGRS